MRTIDLDSWPRRAHFETYRQFDYPHFNITSTIDVERMLPIALEHSSSLTVAITYLLSRTANQIENFRWRIRGDDVVEHEIVHPSITILTPDDLFSFCTMEYVPEYSNFATSAAETITHVRENPTLEGGPQQDDLLYMTSIPWIPFTSFLHPIHMHPVDSIPRFAWGRIHAVEGRKQMPLSVQGHHALMDGLHVGLFFKRMQENYDTAEDLLNT
jgi:chloramphenicol O-acetyltransferase type A